MNKLNNNREIRAKDKRYTRRGRDRSKREDGNVKAIYNRKFSIIYRG